MVNSHVEEILEGYLETRSLLESLYRENAESKVVKGTNFGVSYALECWLCYSPDV